MKKLLAIIFVCIIFMTSATCVCANDGGNQPQSGFSIVINGEISESLSVILNDAHFIPLRNVFEKMGAEVFYRDSDAQFLVLTRDGDIVRHIVGQSAITVNGKQVACSNPSILENNEAYIPVDMLAAVFCPNRIWYENQQLHIQKTMSTNSYHKVIKDVLNVCRKSNFYPERFQRYLNYHVRVPSYTMDQVLFRVNLGLDQAFYTNVSTIQHPYELLVLVNKYYQLPSGFTQYNLVNMNASYTVRDGKQYLLAKVANDNYVKMADAAKKAGLSMKVVSAYRTESYQRGLYNNKVRSSGKTYADNYSARPGHSEHQTGLAVDINSTKVAFEYSSEFKWLKKHAHEYGFILRYPKGKEWITGYAYEPWHYRYVGKEAAQIIYEEGITFEEYYAKYISVNEFR